MSPPLCAIGSETLLLAHGRRRMTPIWRDFLGINTWMAGFVAVLVGFTSSAAIVFSAAAQALGANAGTNGVLDVGAWVWAWA